MSDMLLEAVANSTLIQPQPKVHRDWVEQLARLGNNLNRLARNANKAGCVDDASRRLSIRSFLRVSSLDALGGSTMGLISQE